MERPGDLPPLPAPPTWTDSKQRRREALKKLTMGQKLTADTHSQSLSMLKGLFMENIKKLDTRKFKITVSNGYRPDGQPLPEFGCGEGNCRRDNKEWSVSNDLHQRRDDHCPSQLLLRQNV